MNKKKFERQPITLEEHKRIEKYLSHVSDEGWELYTLICDRYGDEHPISNYFIYGLHYITCIKYKLENTSFTDYRMLKGMPPAMPSIDKPEYDDWYGLYMKNGTPLAIMCPILSDELIKKMRKLLK